MKCYLIKTPDGLVALNSEKELVDGQDYREFSAGEYTAVAAWDQDITNVGNKHTVITGEDLANAIVSFKNRTAAEGEEELEKAKKRALDKIDEDAEKTRQRFATSGSLQAMVYLEKAEEARAYQTATNPIDADYPFLQAEASALAMDIADFAALVLQNRDAWTTAAADIEAIRAAAKAAVRAASDQSAIDTILNSLNWPTPQ
jgi:hypothetical protein